jgi:cysteinyl-tRNA synthetase
MLRTHYRQPIDWTMSSLEESERVLSRWYDIVGDAKAASEPHPKVLEALTDDLNTPQAITELFSLSDAHSLLKSSAQMMGLLQRTGSQRASDKILMLGVDERTVEDLLTSRLAARKAKDFKEADRIREKLAAMGIALKDSKDPKTGEITTTWEVAR